MDTILKSVNKLLPAAKKSKKYLPFFIGFKLLTFTGFLIYIMNRQMILPSQQTVIALLLISIGIVVTFDIRFDPLNGKEQNEIKKIQRIKKIEQKDSILYLVLREKNSS